MGLKDWIARYRPGASQTADAPEAGANLAVAALLVEVLRADYDVGAVERQEVVSSVAALLGLGAEQSRALVEEAERHIDKSHDLYQFTSQVNRTYSDAEKVQLARSALARGAGRRDRAQVRRTPYPPCCGPDPRAASGLHCGQAAGGRAGVRRLIAGRPANSIFCISACGGA